jgi:sulfur relay (sulfurtransferase) DsrC/TusE family protein
MNEIEKFLRLMKRKEKRLIDHILGRHPKRFRCLEEEMINKKMIQKRSDLTFEECIERKMTKTQQEVFFYIDEYWKKYGMGPTMREITVFRKSKSLGSTHEIVGRLIKLGILKKVKGMERSVRPVYINFRTIDAHEELA